MNKTNILYALAFLLSISFANAQVANRERPKGWENLVFGGRFMDRFLPMPDLGGMSSDTWGAPCVIPRDTANGIEEKDWSYWGGNIRLMDDGKYHLFVCRWAENSPKGHFEWGNSIVVHAVANNSFGPYKVIQEVGKGHNPEWYITNGGKYVIYVIDGCYISDNINGPWEYSKFDFNNRDREIIEGLSNLTFAKRDDGSFIMICRGGGVWISKDGFSTWNQVTDARVYPAVDGRFEDPLIWKTNVQYHLIVNDWLGRIAWYMRSKDGIHWKIDMGEAYLPGIARYKDGTIEDWFKFERMKVLQDEYGRAIQANFAVIDTLKWMDKPNDNHSSKLIAIPLTVGRLITVLNKKPIGANTREIKVMIKSEEGFDPNTDMDIESLRFGAPEKVDFGLGCKAINIEKTNNGAIVTFLSEGNGITNDNFAAKLLGKNKKGNLLYAYSRLPGVCYNEPVLSARMPVVDSLTNKLTVEVENFGQVASENDSIHVFKINEGDKSEIGRANIPPLKPYNRLAIDIKTFYKDTTFKQQSFLVVINKGKSNEVSFQNK